MLSLRLIAAATAVLTAIAPAFASSSPFTAIYSFGDSLSDVGNLFLATGGAEPASPPYANGQFSNGPVWVQDLATKFALPALTPSIAAGTDYAWGGATTGYSGTLNPAAPVPTLEDQVGEFLPTPASVAPSNALYTFSIGANDLFFILAGKTTDGLTPEQNAAAAAQVIANEAGDLAAAGAKDLVLFDVPDLGKAPSIIADGPIAVGAASALSYYFDQQVLADLAPVETAGLKVFDLNTYAKIDSIVADPTAFGFSNATNACYDGMIGLGGGTVCSDPNSYLFWDGVHPTAAGHASVANVAYGLTVPEPTTWAMMLLGFAGVGALGARKVRTGATASF